MGSIIAPSIRPGGPFSVFGSPSGGGSFDPYWINPKLGPHPVGILTQLSPFGIGARRYGSFAGKASIAIDEIVIGRLHRPRRTSIETTASLDVYERPDVCEAQAVIALNPVVIDNSFLLVAA